MATNKSIEQISFDTANGVSSFDSLKTVLSRYQELMEDVRITDPELWKQYKRREKKA